MLSAFLWSGCGGEDNPSGGGNTPSDTTGNGGGNTTGVVDPNTVVKGTFTDDRNSQEYKTVKIGGQTWMAKNLNIEAGTSWCYDEDPANCETYGRLYDWETAKTVCPTGWKLPDTAAWNKLSVAVGGSKQGNSWRDAGTKLKSKNGWSDLDNGSSGNGTDDYGFSALPSGGKGDDFYGVGRFGNWWTSTDITHVLPGTYAYYEEMYHNNTGVATQSGGLQSGHAVRCVKQ